MKLRLVTHAERPDLARSEPSLFPAFMAHDPIAAAFWPRLYDVYPDFQLWLLDGKATVGYACTLPVRWDGIPEPRGIDWAMTNGVIGDPSDLCAIVAGIRPEYQGRGLSAVLLRRMAGLATAHGLDCMIAPVRPTWKERYPLTPIDRYVRWRREDGFHYDPWIRAHERVDAEILDPAPRSMTITGSRAEWEEWTGLQFPEDGDYVVPGARSCPCASRTGWARMSSRTSGCGMGSGPRRGPDPAVGTSDPGRTLGTWPSRSRIGRSTSYAPKRHG